MNKLYTLSVQFASFGTCNGSIDHFNFPEKNNFFSSPLKKKLFLCNLFGTRNVCLVRGEIWNTSPWPWPPNMSHGVNPWRCRGAKIPGVTCRFPLLPCFSGDCWEVPVWLAALAVYVGTHCPNPIRGSQSFFSPTKPKISDMIRDSQSFTRVQAWAIR